MLILSVKIRVCVKLRAVILVNDCYTMRIADSFPEDTLLRKNEILV